MRADSETVIHDPVWRSNFVTTLTRTGVPAGSPSRGGDVKVYVLDIHQPSLPTPFHSLLLSVSIFVALSTVFHLINPPDNSLLSYSVLAVLYMPYRSLQPYISL